MPAPETAPASVIHTPKRIPTPAQLQHRAKLKELGRKGGLAGKRKTGAEKPSEAEVHDIVKDCWSDASVLMIKEALKAARVEKTDAKQLVGKFTAAAIAYDKRWAKQTLDSTEIDFPSTLVSAITKALTVQPQVNQQVSTNVAHLTEVQDMSNEAPIDPMLLSPGA
jgi:hypothetical protein